MIHVKIINGRFVTCWPLEHMETAEAQWRHTSILQGTRRMAHGTGSNDGHDGYDQAFNRGDRA